MVLETWRGTALQWSDLIRSLRNNCEPCGRDSPFGVLCPEHKALLADQQALDRLAFERHEAARWIDQEWRA